MFSLNMKGLVGFIATLLFILIFIIPQAYFWIKLPFLGVVLLYVLVNVSSGRFEIYSYDSLKYYLLIATITVTWALIGAVNGNHIMALYDGIRLFVIYNLIFVLLIVYLTNIQIHRYVLLVTSIGSLGIALIAFYTIADLVLGLNSIPFSVRSEMYMQVGLHSGHTQLNNINIGMYAFLLPFLISYTLLEVDKKPKYIYLTLFISTVALVLGSRRAIIYIIFLIPLLCLFVDSFITSKLRFVLLKRVIKIYVYSAIIISIGLSLVIYHDLVDINGFLDRLLDVLATDENSPRQLQFTALMQGFYDNPIIGTGFGGIASVTRSETPWNYELIYIKLLFHSGLLGTVALVSIIGFYTLKAIKLCKLDRSNYSINVSLIIGFLSILIATLTNPYLGSFDFLLALAVPPLVIGLVKRDQHRTRCSVTYR